MKKNAGRRIVFVILVILLIIEGGILAALMAGKLRQSVGVRPLPCTHLSGAAAAQCWEKTVDEAVGRGDVSGALTLVSRMHDAYPGMAETCHALTHAIGTGAYRLYSRGKQFEITSKTAYCSYGFYHGFMEELVSRKRDMGVARSFCAYVDEKIRRESPDASLQCFHGIGHGTVNNHDPKSWGNEDALVLSALELCSDVASNSDELSRCATGVFNGIAIFYTTGEYNLTVDRRDPLKICRKQEARFQDPCYISMNTLLLSLADYELASASLYLGSIPDAGMARHAMINLASPVGTRNIDETNHDKTVAVCRTVPARLHLSCIQGYAYGFLEHGVPGKEYIKPLAFCGLDILTKEEQNACFEYILSYLPRWYGSRKVQTICSRLVSPYKEQCLGGAAQSL